MHLSLHYTQIPINTQEIPQSILNIKYKTRSNPLKWSGQFSPQLVETLLRTYATQTTRVFDPFLGSGTLLLEAGQQKLTASGTEINPAASTLSSIYRFINISINQRIEYINTISNLLNKQFELQVFKANQPNYDEFTIKEYLLGTIEKCTSADEVALLKSLIVLLDFKKPSITADKIFQTWQNLVRLISSLPYSQNPITVYHADARQTPLTAGSVDMVLTSPPYINVFNYHQQYRDSAELLNYDILRIAKSEIGSNRKHRSNRFLTVVQYCIDMAAVIKELMRIMMPQSRIILVVGRESSIRSTPFLNGEIVTEIAHRIFGLSLELRQERCFRNRFGQLIYEDILHFMTPHIIEHKTSYTDAAYAIAQDTLVLAMNYAPDKARQDIKQALETLASVAASPIFEG